MATVKEILETESAREKGTDTSVVNLFQEGSFLRAYEQSAWLCVKFLHEFNATKRFNKSVDKEIVFIGFPNSSLQKWLPNGSELQTVSEKQYSFTLPVRFDDKLQQNFQQWKDGLPVSDNTKDTTKPKTVASSGVTFKGNASLSSVMSQILAFPIESKSPMDCMLFLAELKKQLSQIL